MSETPTIKTDGGKPAVRGLRIALMMSLMLNLLVIGVLICGVMRVSRMEAMMPPDQPDIRSLWRVLPDGARDELRSMARTRGFGDAGPRPSRDERRARAAAATDALVSALRADPFDPAGFARLMTGDREARNRRVDAANAAFAAEVARLTPADRMAMAERLATAGPRDDRRRHDH